MLAARTQAQRHARLPVSANRFAPPYADCAQLTCAFYAARLCTLNAP